MTKDRFLAEQFKDQTAWDNNNSIKDIIYRKPKQRTKLNNMFRRKARRKIKENIKKGIDKDAD